jgi:hypothetical protein
VSSLQTKPYNRSLESKANSKIYSDIGYGIPTEKIFSSLTKTYDLARGKGSKVLALTVPECGSKYAKATATRNELNKCILNHKKTKL